MRLKKQKIIPTFSNGHNLLTKEEIFKICYPTRKKQFHLGIFESDMNYDYEIVESKLNFNQLHEL